MSTIARDLGRLGRLVVCAVSVTAYSAITSLDGWMLETAAIRETLAAFAATRNLASRP